MPVTAPKLKSNQEELTPCPFTCPEGEPCASVGRAHKLHRCKDRDCACHSEWRAYFDRMEQALKLDASN